MLGLGGSGPASLGETQVLLKPHFSGRFEMMIDPIVTKKIVTINGSEQATKGFEKLVLADPLNEDGEIDLLLGADMFPYLIKRGQMKKDGILAQQTELGYILSGGMVETPKVLVVQTPMDDINLRLDSLFSEKEPEPEDEVVVEEFFNSTTTRGKDG